MQFFKDFGTDNVLINLFVCRVFESHFTCAKKDHPRNAGCNGLGKTFLSLYERYDLFKLIYHKKYFSLIFEKIYYIQDSPNLKVNL